MVPSAKVEGIFSRTVWLLLAFSLTAASAQDGSELFLRHCAACHRAGSETRAPLPAALAQLSRKAILASLETGTMKAQGAALKPAERTAIAAFLAPRTAPVAETSAGRCAANPELKDASGWNGWGVDLANSRYQSSAGLTADQVPKLKLKWAFGFPGAIATFGQPAIAGGRIFLGSQDGTVYSLDARTGCTYWTFKAPATVRSAISVAKTASGRYAAWFGDVQANVYAVDARNGELLWKAKVDDHPFARVTAAPKWHAGRLYVPVSSVEEVPAANPKYACCTFRGSVVALDADTGKQIWKTYAIPDAPKPTRQNAAGTQLMGPAGAAIWSSPTLDLGRKLIYVATGNAYAEPHTGYADAVLALDMDTGALRWARQMTEGDGWNFSCINPNPVSCPQKSGPDLDFGSSPILVGNLLLAGQKSGIMHALDADQKGKIVWQTRIGKGGALGGIEWGSAADGEKVYAALSDINRGKPEEGGGLFALQIKTGEKVWHFPPPKPACAGLAGCSAAQMAPVSATPGVVFAGSMDGHLRAHRAKDGALLWDFDTRRDFQTVNGVQAKGGSLNASGPTISGGMVFCNSGYGVLGGMPGNVLLAFAVE